MLERKVPHNMLSVFPCSDPYLNLNLLFFFGVWSPVFRCHSALFTFHAECIICDSPATAGGADREGALL